MRLTDLAELSAEILTKYYENNTDMFFEYLHEDCLWIGPAKGQTVRTKEALQKIFSAENNTLTFSIYNLAATPVQISKNSAEVFLSFIVDTFWQDGSSNRVYQRITLSWENKGENPKICVCHVSNAIDYDARDTIYPIHYLEKHSQAVLYSKLATKLHFQGISGSVLHTVSDEILYLESLGNHTLIHTSSQVFECNKRLSLLAADLGDSFIRCHSSFLVNPLHVLSIERFFITLSDNSKIPIPEKKYTAVKKKLLSE